MVVTVFISVTKSQENFREEGFIWTPDLENYSPSWWKGIVPRVGQSEAVSRAYSIDFWSGGNKEVMSLDLNWSWVIVSDHTRGPTGSTGTHRTQLDDWLT